MVKTDSVKPQNKVGLPIGAPGTIFFNIIPPPRSGEREIKMTKKKQFKKEKQLWPKKIILEVVGKWRNECVRSPERLR